jgi:hypothetical protein
MVVLLLAWFFRWDYVGTKTYPTGFIRYKVDRWTSFLTGGGGYKWMDIFDLGAAGTAPAYDSKEQHDLYERAVRVHDNGTALWRFLVGADALWFVILVRKRPRVTSPGVPPSPE